MKILQSYLGTFCMIMMLLGMVALTPANAQAAKKPLKNMDVTGTTQDGKTFNGKATITSIAINPAGGAFPLLAEGFLEGKVDNKPVHQSFRDAPLSLSHRNGGGATSGVVTSQQPQLVCDIIFLDLGPIFLDVLGLTVDLSRITLDINAVPGSGNLLGNLLCAVTGLLDNFSLTDVLIGIIENLLNAINQLI